MSLIMPKITNPKSISIIFAKMLDFICELWYNNSMSYKCFTICPLEAVVNYGRFAMLWVQIAETV